MNYLGEDYDLESNSIDFNSLPDISQQVSAETEGLLSKVGMEGIELPLKINIEGQSITVLSTVDAFVSLDKPKSKGIHMSRLYLTLQSIFSNNDLDSKHISKALNEFINTHKSLSKSSYLNFNFSVPIKQKSLVSNNSGWRAYPVQVNCSLVNGKLTTRLKTEVLYSSTCPCSEALARELNAQSFEETFRNSDNLNVKKVTQWMRDKSNTLATPHAQRSSAFVEVELNQLNSYATVDLIQDIETALSTPVQAVVKREDEQEFARLNGNNLMFCEDAGRRLKKLLDNKTQVISYNAKVVHKESLHPHNAVAYIEG